MGFRSKAVLQSRIVFENQRRNARVDTYLPDIAMTRETAEFEVDSGILFGQNSARDVVPVLLTSEITVLPISVVWKTLK
jgi:hypothetical protein